jgi:hypothetical protein
VRKEAKNLLFQTQLSVSTLPYRKKAVFFFHEENYLEWAE